ncbi:hypothetical protein D3C76_961270 [compost metagenome]
MTVANIAWENQVVNVASFSMDEESEKVYRLFYEKLSKMDVGVNLNVDEKAGKLIFSAQRQHADRVSCIIKETAIRDFKTADIKILDGNDFVSVLYEYSRVIIVEDGDYDQVMEVCRSIDSLNITAKVYPDNEIHILTNDPLEYATKIQRKIAEFNGNAKYSYLKL